MPIRTNDEEGRKLQFLRYVDLDFGDAGVFRRYEYLPVGARGHEFNVVMFFEAIKKRGERQPRRRGWRIGNLAKGDVRASIRERIRKLDAGASDVRRTDD